MLDRNTIQEIRTIVSRMLGTTSSFILELTSALKSPPAIGVTTPAAGKFTDLTATGLTASLPVFTDASSKLVSKSISDTLTALGLGDALVYKGAINCSTNPNYPAANAGDCYVVSVAGKIGGASGVFVVSGDLALCKVDGSASGDQASVGANWDILEKNIDLTNIVISGGTIDGTTVGTTTPAAGRFGAAGNYTDIPANGHQSMLGTARAWRDELGSAESLKTVGPGVSLNTTESVIEYVNTANLSDYVFKNCQLNHDRDETSVISPHIHFFMGDGSNVPNWLIEYRWQVQNGTKTTGWTQVPANTLVTTSPGSGVTKHGICECADITPPGGSALSDIVQFRILRDTGNTSGKFSGADPYTGTVGMLSFDVHIQINSLGSTSEYIK